MAIEIERKYLVNQTLWEALEKPEGEFYRQGYLSIDIEKTIRVRVTNDTGYITIKGKTTNASRLEYEYAIPKAEAIELLDNFTENNIEKVRYKLNISGKIWEVDVFSGQNQGLIVAEIELNTIDEPYTIPIWIALEVTDDNRYYNANLSKNPYLNW